MGLTIHFELTARTRSPGRAHALVEAIDRLARELPFEALQPIRRLGPEALEEIGPLWLRGDLPREDLRWRAIAAGEPVAIPWMASCGATAQVYPAELMTFAVAPGLGCESLELGLARYPPSIDYPYRPCDDDRFHRRDAEGRVRRGAFDWQRFARHCERRGIAWVEEEYRQTPRRIRTGLGSAWRFGGFCKTVYAEDDLCGGLPNFLRCHLGVVALLERIAALPGVEVEITDEGHWGCSCSCSAPDRDLGAFLLSRGVTPERLAADAERLRALLGDRFVSAIDRYAGAAGLRVAGPRDPGLVDLLEATARLARASAAPEEAAARAH